MNPRPSKRIASAVVLAALISFSLTGQSSAQDFVELSNKAGVAIKAKIVLVVGEEVEIELQDGRRTTLPIAKFSLSSQELIKKHAADSKPEPAAPSANFIDEPIFQFADLEFKEKKLDHFRVRTIDTGFDPADRYAEKAFDVMAETMPTLTALFEEQKFRAPGKEPNSQDFPEPDKQFRHDIYLVTESGDYQNMVAQFSATFSDERSRQNFLNSSGTIGNFVDFDHRMTVIRKEAGRPAQQLLAHQIGFQLLGARIEQPNIPFWLRMGAGYYTEHQLFKKCTVFYVDFQNYYESESGVPGGAGNMTKAEILSNSAPWTKPLKELCKNGKRTGLERLFAVTTAELTPNDSGYAMAFFSFMTSTDARIASFNTLLDQIKDGTTPSPQDMADAFGYATPAEFEEAWYAYIMSSAFK